MSSETLELLCGDASAVIARRGAEAISWRSDGLDLLWKPQPEVWGNVSPLLFPVVGWCRDRQIRVGDDTYPMGVHGFAAHCDFEIVRHERDAAVLLLRDSEKTRAFYPFAFEFEAAYKLSATALDIVLTATNTGTSPLPYACGVHPGFRWPFAGGARDGHRIEFSADERAKVPVIGPGGLFTRDTRDIALDGRILPLNDALFSAEALCFLNANSTALAFAAPDGRRIAARFEHFPHLALWTRPPAPYLCIEAWTGHGDPQGFAGDIFEKPGMTILQAGEARSHRATFALQGHCKPI